MSLRNRHHISSESAGTWLLDETEPAERNSTLSARPNSSQMGTSPYSPYQGFEFSFGLDDLREFCEALVMKLRKLFEAAFIPNASLVAPNPIPEETSNLMSQFRTFVQTPYDSDNVEHEQVLQQYWNLCCPSEELESRKSSQWKELGFQGVDPATDFRGAGIFGLRCLVYFASTYPELFNDMRKGYVADTQERYPFSIAGLNILMSLYELLGWGFKRTQQDPIAARTLIALLFESEIDMDFEEPIQETSEPEEHPTPILDLLTGTGVHEVSKVSQQQDLLHFDGTPTTNTFDFDFSTFDEKEEDISNTIDTSTLFQHEIGSEKRMVEKIFYEMFCFSFYKLHQNWIGRPSVSYMDFPIVLQDTTHCIHDYLRTQSPSPQHIQSTNQSSNIPL